jgi:hypothetical protein
MSTPSEPYRRRGPNNGVGINWTTILLAFIAMVGTTFSTVATIYLSQMKDATEATRAAAVTTAGHVKEIEHSVNSERSTALDKIEKLTDEIRQMTRENARLVEQARGRGSTTK